MDKKFSLLSHRHPDPSSRYQACEITVALQQPDFQILSWTQEDIATCDSEKARVLGSALEEGHCLYKDLQCIYCHNNSNNTSVSNFDESKEK